MLSIVISIAYGALFYFSARRRDGARPYLWASIGFFLFLLGTHITARLILKSFLVLDAADLRALRDLIGISVVVGSLGISNGITLLAWKRLLAMPVNWLWRDAHKRLASVRSLHMPGGFPWVFLSTGVAFSMIGLLTTVLVFSRALPPEVGGGDHAYLFSKFFHMLGEVALIAVVFWKCKNWLAISLWWAGISAVMTQLAGLYGMNAQFGWFGSPRPEFEWYFDPLFLLFDFVSALVAFAVIMFGVRRWGAVLAGLLLTNVVARFVILVPDFFTLSADELLGNSLVSLVSGVLWTAMLYIGLLVKVEISPAPVARPAESAGNSANCPWTN